MRQSETIAELATALAKAQGQIEDATKDGINPAFRSKYADLAAVRAVIREPLAVNDLSIMQFPRTRQNVVEVETMLVHKSGEFVSETLEIPVAKFDAHGIGSGITYGRRYGLMSVLCLAAVDDDGNAAVEKAPTAAKPAAPKDEPAKSAMSKDDVSKLAKQLTEIAGQGAEALTAKWRSMTGDQRRVFDPEAIRELKEIAAKADATKSEAE
jgi:hypothetical protein